MSTFTSIIVLLIGIAELGFGIYLFYMFLPFWYGLFGATLGVALSQTFFDQSTWFTSILSWAIILGLAITLAVASYVLEPYRRYLLGGIIGAILGLALAGMFVVGGFWAFLFAVLGAILFGFLTYWIFDPMIIVVSSLAGAAMIMDSVFIMTHWSIVNRYENAPMTVLLWGLLVVVGIAWQSSSVFRNLKSESINVVGA